MPRSTKSDNKAPVAIWPDGPPRPLAPYTPAIKAGGWLFVSGQLASDFKNGLAPEAASANPNLGNSLELQSRFTLANLAKTVQAGGCDIAKDAVRIWQWFTSPYPTMEEFKAGNTFGMVAFTSYGLFWWWFALLQWTIGAGWLKPPPPVAGGAILLMWGVFTFLMWIVAFRLSKAVWSIFLLLWITFFLLAWGDFGYSFGTGTCGQIGGWFGLATGLDALFVAFVEVLNATANRTILPLGRPFIA